MRAIFLDIDGVLCTPLSAKLSERFRLPLERQLFDPVGLYWLRWLTRRADAKIVLSSSWRDALYMDDPLCRAMIGNLYDRLARNRTPIYDVTPLLGSKGEEIAAWLREHPCKNYVALDDYDCFDNAPEVRAHWIPIPDSAGLRRREAKAALRALLSTDKKGG